MLFTISGKSVGTRLASRRFRQMVLSETAGASLTSPQANVIPTALLVYPALSFYIPTFDKAKGASEKLPVFTIQFDLLLTEQLAEKALFLALLFLCGA